MLLDAVGPRSWRRASDRATAAGMAVTDATLLAFALWALGRVVVRHLDPEVENYLDAPEIAAGYGVVLITVLVAYPVGRLLWEVSDFGLAPTTGTVLGAASGVLALVIHVLAALIMDPHMELYRPFFHLGIATLGAHTLAGWAVERNSQLRGLPLCTAPGAIESLRRLAGDWQFTGDRSRDAGFAMAQSTLVTVLGCSVAVFLFTMRFEGVLAGVVLLCIALLLGLVFAVPSSYLVAVRYWRSRISPEPSSRAGFLGGGLTAVGTLFGVAVGITLFTPVTVGHLIGNIEWRGHGSVVEYLLRQSVDFLFVGLGTSVAVFVLAGWLVIPTLVACGWKFERLRTEQRGPATEAETERQRSPR